VGAKGGPKTGGRRQGSLNRRTLENTVIREKALAEARAQQALVDWRSMRLETGPFEGGAHDLLKWVYRSPTLPASMRVEAAKSAIGFETPKLAVANNFNVSVDLKELIAQSYKTIDATDAQAVIDAQGGLNAERELGEKQERPVSAAVPTSPLISVGPLQAPSPPAPPPTAPSGDAVSYGPFPPADPRVDDAQRFEELSGHVRERQDRRDRPPEPQTEMPIGGWGNSRPYLPERSPPRSAAAEDMERHVRNVRRMRGLD
jgi:hypothetical protein